MEHQFRKNVSAGKTVAVIQKRDQRSGNRTVGVVKNILTNSSFHSRGIKVRLENGIIGRVAEIL